MDLDTLNSWCETLSEAEVYAKEITIQGIYDDRMTFTLSDIQAVTRLEERLKLQGISWTFRIIQHPRQCADCYRIAMEIPSRTVSGKST